MKSNTESIFEKFPVTEKEYAILNEKFGTLCDYASWQLIYRNSRNNHSLDQEDISQDLRIALLIAGSYYKRQTYIERCLAVCKEYIQDGLISSVVSNLTELWSLRTRHGANRTVFGGSQEEILDLIVLNNIPEEIRPSKQDALLINADFSGYCKAIAWNTQRALGKKITREKPIRSNQVSLSEYEYLVRD